MVTLQIRVSEDVKQSFEDLFENLSGDEIVRTKGELIENLIERFNNPKKVKDQELIDKAAAQAKQIEENEGTIAELKGKITELEKEIEDLKQEKEVLENGNNLLNTEINELNTKLTDKDTLINQERDKIKEFDVIVGFGATDKKLLLETLKRLSTKYNTDITASDLLRKMFLRYTIERYSEWFYPFVLTDKDIVDTTGIAIKDWKNFLNGK